MNSIELMGIDWLGHGWLLILAFTAAVLVVAALRKPCRRLFGASRAFQLWLLPPLAMLASQLPHVAAAPDILLSPVASTITSAATTLPMHAIGSSAVDWRTGVVLLWLAGTLITVGLASFAQTRYRDRLRGATRVVDLSLRWPVLRAAGTDIGPALVGAWRSRIVLPADFERRYDATEQTLILAHEAMHARRRDGWWCLLAQAVTAMLWFHPLAWWALSALRHDQELACDAAVLHEHGDQRRSYAHAMLKTQSAVFALPVGCPWSPRHPITERIAMLKQSQPNALCRRTGGVLVALLVTAAASAVYAATPTTSAKSHVGSITDRYTLDVDVAMGGRPTSARFSRCVKPNEYAELSGSDTDKLSWQGRFAVLPAAKGELEIRAQIDTRFERAKGDVRTLSGKPVVRTMPGQQATIVFGQVVDGKHPENEKLQDNTIKIRMTPTTGCSGASLAREGNPSAMSAGEADDTAPAVREYQLNMSIELAADNGRSENVRRAALALCTTPGKAATVKVHDWQVDATAVPDGNDRLRVDLAISGIGHEPLAQTSLHGALSEMLHADGKSMDGKSRYALEVTPLAGCPARTEANAKETPQA